MTKSRLLFGVSCVALTMGGIPAPVFAQVQAQAPAIAALTVIQEPPLPTGQTYPTDAARATEVRQLRANMPLAQEIMARDAHALPVADAELNIGLHTQRFHGDSNSGGSHAPASLTADYVERNANALTYTAVGHVEFIQDGKILRADKVIYDVAADSSIAIGNVVLSEPDGDVYFAKRFRISRDMTVGVASGLETYLGSGAHFKSKNSVKTGDKTVMQQAVYTPCECEEGNANSGWNARATSMVYDQDSHQITSKSTTFDVLGVPVLWTPWARFGDGQIKQESGFLAPTVGYKSNLGGVVTEDYYWALAPDRDAELGTLVSTKKLPVVEGQYRQRFDTGQLLLDASTNYSDRVATVNIDPTTGEGQTVNRGDEWRGHFFGTATTDLNDLWRAGAQVQLVSDSQYLREYDFSHSDVLENQLYAERFDDRDYAKIEALAFQDTRVSTLRTDQPDVLPSATMNLVGAPNALLGGRWNFDSSLLGLTLDGDKQDVGRVSADAGWQRRLVTPFGLVNTVDLGARTDGYIVHDRDVSDLTSTEQSSGFNGRVTSHAQLTSSYPMAKQLQSSQIIIEPIAAISAVPANHVNNPEIPNEDSQDVELDASDLFDWNRYSGLDRVEDGVHATYGARTGIYGNGGGYGTVFLGQSYQIGSADNTFPAGSGLSNRASDVVGQISLGEAAAYGAYYRFLLSSDNLSPERHEITLFSNWDKFRFESRFDYTKSLSGTDLDASREQTENNVAYAFNDAWRVRLGAINDLGDHPGLRRATAGIDYFGCCLSMSLTAERNVTTVSSGDNGTDVMFRIGLKGIGGFQTPAMTDASDDGLWRDSREIPKY